LSPEHQATLERIHNRHKDTATYYEVSSVLKPGKAESLKPEDRIHRKACESCGLVIEASPTDEKSDPMHDVDANPETGKLRY
jgi:hypothetical protein